MKFDLFISYSHQRDRVLASALQSISCNLGKPLWRPPRVKVFRDETSLSANPELWPPIEDALSKSRHFLLIASPESARSPWVAKEIEKWFELRGADEAARTLLIALSEGELAWLPGCSRLRMERQYSAVASFEGKVLRSAAMG